jgi:3-polyprenyl-4-hydroxybenzoate decarboxylase
VGEDVNVHDYRQVFSAVMDKVLPGRDIFISKGPLDVLDHAAPETGFGGKLGIDATGAGIQHGEHMRVEHSSIVGLLPNEGIFDLYSDLMIDGHALVVLAFRDYVDVHTKNNILERVSHAGARFILLMDKEVEPRVGRLVMSRKHGPFKRLPDSSFFSRWLPDFFPCGRWV